MYIFKFIYYFPIKPRIRFLLKMYFWWYNNIRPKSSNLLFCDKKKSKTLGRVLNWLNKCMYLIITFRSPQVRVASVTVQINEVLSCTKRHAWKMKYKKRVHVFACQPLSTHNCAVKKLKFSNQIKKPRTVILLQYQKKTEPF